jgi:hypothetical protein
MKKNNLLPDTFPEKPLTPQESEVNAFGLFISYDKEWSHKDRKKGTEKYSKFSFHYRKPDKASTPASQDHSTNPLSKEDFTAEMRKSYWFSILLGFIFFVLSAVVTKIVA